MLVLLGTLAGGLGLLLIGMGLMTDGLKLAAGNTLRDLLALWTNSRGRGLLSGLMITGIVQSSSAVTVATIGFANAGMLTLERAIWVIYGSNVGTTMTAWIVALVGFRLNMEALALPLIGLGAVLRLTGTGRHRGYIGLALVGFGLLFLGIETLKSVFDSLGAQFSLPTADSLILRGVLLYVSIGLLLTTLMQSSSAAMVVALGAAESGLIPFDAAAAVVIGANLGTTSTAVIAVFGATPVAKRLALGHVFFNVITAAMAILLLAPMLWLGDMMRNFLHLGSAPSVALALFHTTFNLMGVLLMWPLSDRLVKGLNRIFRTREENESQPRYLDRTVLALPYIAADALTLELSRIAELSIHTLQKSLHQPLTLIDISASVGIIRNLARESGRFSAELNRSEMLSFVSEALLSLMHATQEYLLSAEIAEVIAALGDRVRRFRDSEFSQELEAFIAAADAHLEALTPDNDPAVITDAGHYAAVEAAYDRLKITILLNISIGRLEVSDMDELLQFANQGKRACRHLWKAARRLNAVRESLQRSPEGQVVESVASDRANIDKLKDTEQALAEVVNGKAEPASDKA